MRIKIKNNNILVVGGAGFIGSTLVDRLNLEGSKDIVILDNMFLGDEKNIKGAIKNGAIFYKDDAEIYSTLEYIFEKHNIDIVFNLATKALNYSFINPRNTFETNVKVILNLLELQRRKYFKVLCHCSTSEVYGTAVYEPMDENHPKNPTTTYAAGKAAADLALESYVKLFDLDAFIVRPFNNFGPRQNYTGFLAGVIPKTIYRIQKGEKPIIYGSGDQTRDFIYVYDTVDLIIKVFDKLKPGESVNISCDYQISIINLIMKISELLNYQNGIIYKKERKSDVECHIASNDKIKSLVDYDLTSFEEGLKNTINWYLELFNRKKYDKTY